MGVDDKVVTKLGCMCMYTLHDTLALFSLTALSSLSSVYLLDIRGVVNKLIETCVCIYSLSTHLILDSIILCLVF